jgi:hypothetical protein
MRSGMKIYGNRYMTPRLKKSCLLYYLYEGSKNRLNPFPALW